MNTPVADDTLNSDSELSRPAQVKTWSYFAKGVVVGPVDEVELLLAAERGEIDLDTLVYTDEFGPNPENWHQLGVTELADKVSNVLDISNTLSRDVADAASNASSRGDADVVFTTPYHGAESASTEKSRRDVSVASGYFDFLTAPAFKTALDGTTLFFPWGFLGRGYPIKSELDYRRLRQQLKINYVLGFVLFICAFALLGYAELVLATVALVLVYLVWVGFRLRGAQPSDEKLSYQEAIAAQTSKISPKLLWSLEIGSIIFVIGGMFILVSEPDQWLKAAGEIFFFGVCSIAYANMLLIQKKASRMRVSQQTAGSHLSRRRAPNQAYDHADQVGLSTMNTDMHEPPVQPPPISAVNSAKMAIPAKTARLLIFLLLGFGVWAYLGFPSPDTLLYWPSAKEECVKFAGKHRELFDPGKSIRAVSSWMKHGKVVVEIGAFNDSDESYRPRICVVGGGTIEIVSLLETGAWR